MPITFKEKATKKHSVMQYNWPGGQLRLTHILWEKKKNKTKRTKRIYSLSTIYQQVNNLLSACRPLPCSNQHKATLGMSVQDPLIIKFSIQLQEVGQELQQSQKLCKPQQTLSPRSLLWWKLCSCRTWAKLLPKSCLPYLPVLAPAQPAGRAHHTWHSAHWLTLFFSVHKTQLSCNPLPTPINKAQNKKL